MQDNIKVLVIDDEPSICEILQKVLEKEGYEVDSANNGSIAFKMFLKKNYNLVISDISMPGINGIDLLQKIKEIKPETEVLIITAYNCHTNIKQTFRYKAAGLIFKPFDLIQLKTKVKRILEFQDHLSSDYESDETSTVRNKS